MGPPALLTPGLTSFVPHRARPRTRRSLALPRPCHSTITIPFTTPITSAKDIRKLAVSMHKEAFREVRTWRAMQKRPLARPIPPHLPTSPSESCQLGFMYRLRKGYYSVAVKVRENSDCEERKMRVGARSERREEPIFTPLSLSTISSQHVVNHTGGAKVWGAAVAGIVAGVGLLVVKGRSSRVLRLRG